MSLYSVVRTSYHAILPENIRHQVYLITPGRLKRLRRKLIQTIENTGDHDEIYNKAYYDKFVEPTMQMSVTAMADTICETLHPASVADVGCGTGVLLATLRDRGITVRGYEYSEAALAICAERGLPVTRLDIENDPIPDASYDLVVSTEVAEHLPEACADRFVEMLCALSPVTVLTAATPGAGGTDHANEQPNAYWIEKMGEQGRQFDEETSMDWRSRWKDAGVAACFASSVMVFRSNL